jgi:hypothetical protein
MSSHGSLRFDLMFVLRMTCSDDAARSMLNISVRCRNHLPKVVAAEAKDEELVASDC